jgi:hypothetical protein
MEVLVLVLTEQQTQAEVAAVEVFMVEQEEMVVQELL